MSDDKVTVILNNHQGEELLSKVLRSQPGYIEGMHIKVESHGDEKLYLTIPMGAEAQKVYDRVLEEILHPVQGFHKV